MRIFFFSPNGQPNGPRARIFNFAKYLQQKKHDVTIFTKSHFHATKNVYNPQKTITIEKRNNINIIWIKTIVYTTSNIKRFVSELQFGMFAFCISVTQKKPDIVIADSVTPINSIFAFFSAKIRNAIFVHQIRDVWPIALVFDGSIKKNCIAYYLFRMIEKYIYKNSDWICSTLPYVKKHIRQSGGNPKKITYIRNGVDIDSFTKVKPYTCTNKRIKVIYVGTLSLAHDISTLIQGVALLSPNEAKRFEIFIYGDGIKKLASIELVRQLNIRNIFFKGMVAKKRVPKILEKADLLVALVLKSDAYKYGHNLNKLYDYFAAGRPILFSGVVPNDDVKKARAGFSIEPENPKLFKETLLKFSRLKASKKIAMAKRAKEYGLNNFNKDICAKKFEKMICKISNQ